MNIRSILSTAVRTASWRAAVPLSTNFLSSVLGVRDPLSPLHIAWLLTYRCNCRCRQCDCVDSKASLRQVAGELSRERKMELADEIGRSWTWGISLSGGEPLLDTSFMDILSCLKKHRKVVNVCTNGMLLGQFAKELIDGDVDTITVSFDSHTPEEHDRLRGHAGTFAKALAGIEAVRSLRRGKRPRLAIKGVISPANFRHLDEYCSFFSPYADEISFQPIQNNSWHGVNDEALLFRESDEQEFRECMDEFLRRRPAFDTHYYRGMADFLFRPQTLRSSGRFRCLFMSSMYFAIDPYGEASGCFSCGSAGNVRHGSLANVWRSGENHTAQKAMRSRDARCVCWLYYHSLDGYLLRAYSLLGGR